MNEKIMKCCICKDNHTSVNVETEAGYKVFICKDCLDKAKDNFVWLCMNCGKSYIRPKKMVINRVKDLNLKRAYMLCEHEVIIQGIDLCISCNPEAILETVFHGTVGGTA